MSNSYERIYYENEIIWKPERNEGIDNERTRLAIEWLPKDIISVLDVGCGNGIFTNRLHKNKSVLIVGLDRSFSALRHVQGCRSQGDATLLPFGDASFDLVASMEVIEHIPQPLFGQVITELFRVSGRYILITVPYKEEREHKFIKCPYCSCQFHPNYHMRRFDLSDLQDLFSDQTCVDLINVKGIVPVSVPRFPRLWNFLRKVYRSGHDFPPYAICPQCGFSLYGSHKNGVVGKKGIETTTNFGKRFRAIWPKRTTHSWWMALYAKGGKSDTSQSGK